MPPARSPVDAALADLSRVFDKLGVDWFLFGAQAAILYGSTRVTEDIDVTVALGETAGRQLVSALGFCAFALRVKDSAGFVERTRVLPILHVPTSIPVDIVRRRRVADELASRNEANEAYRAYRGSRRIRKRNDAPRFSARGVVSS